MDFEYRLSNIADMYTNRKNFSYPLWDLRKHEKKFVEFQLFAEKTDIFNNNDWLTELNHNVFTCHICDVNVPIQFNKQHSHSSKHKAFKTIIEICLDRLKRQIDNDTIESNTVKHTNVHFCDHCSVAVTENDKIIHSLSEDHLMNVIKDERLIEFEKIFLNQKEFIHNDAIYVKNLDKQSEVDNNVSDIGNNKDGVSNTLSLAVNEKAIKATHSIIENDVTIITLSQEHTKRTEIDNVNEQGEMPNLDSVYEKNYLGKINDMWTHCIICVAKITNATDHINSESHKSNLKALPNKLSKGTKILCKICNVPVKYKKTFLHLQNDKHLENEEKLIPIKPKNEHIFDHFKLQECGEILLCKFCNVSLPQTASLSHLQSNEHIRMCHSILKCNQIRLNETGEYYCESCNVQLLKGFEHVHITNQFHKDQIEFNIPKSSGDCKTKEEEKEDKLANIEPNIKPNTFIDDNENNKQLIEATDKITLNNTTSNISPLPIQTSESKVDTQFVALIPNSKGNVSKTENSQTNLTIRKPEQWPSLEYYCDICEIKIPNNYKSKLAHKYSDNHRINLQKYDDLNGRSNPQIEESTTIASANENCDYLFEKTKRENLLNCLVCYLPISSKNTQQHVTARKHELRYKKLLADNMMTNVNGNIMYCEACDTLIDIKNEIKHIKTTEHIDNLKETKVKMNKDKFYHCKVCDIDVPNTKRSIKNHNNNNKLHKRNENQRKNSIEEKLNIANELVTQNTIEPRFQINFKNQPELVCRICKEEMKEPQMLLHLKTNEHLQTLRDAFSVNKMKFKITHFECALCHLHIAIDYAISHIDTLNHKKMMFLHEANGTDTEFSDDC